MRPVATVLIAFPDHYSLNVCQLLHLSYRCIPFIPQLSIFVEHQLNLVPHEHIHLFLPSDDLLIDLLESSVFIRQLRLLLPHMNDLLLDFEQQIDLLVLAALVRGLCMVVLVVVLIVS